MKIRTPVLLSYAFRPFFLINGIFAILVVFAWIMTLHAKGLQSVTLLWHNHEMLTWAQLGFHEKPCGLLNIEGYYDGLIGFLENSFAQKFVKELYRPLLMKADKPAMLLDQFSGYKAPKVRKWMDEDDL